MAAFVVVVAGFIFIVSFFLVTGGFGPVLEAISGAQGQAAGLNPYTAPPSAAYSRMSLLVPA